MDRPDFSRTSPGSGVQTRKSKAGTPLPRSDLSMPNTSKAVRELEDREVGNHDHCH